MKQHLTTWKERNQKIVKVISGIVIFTTIIGLAIYFFLDLKEETDDITDTKKPVVVVATPTPTETKEDIVTKKGWMVDIKGEVTTPGTYAVDDSMRIIDVIYLAGELTTNADTSLLNLSKKVEDQMVIIIYSKEEVKQMKDTINREKELQNACTQQELLKNDACIETEQKEEINTKININTSSIEDLLTLTGIGTAKAEAILTYRSTKVFETIEELMEVPGIGESLFAAIKDQITVE